MIIKPGVKTSEFWGLVVVNMANMAAALQGSLEPKWASILAVASTIGYAIARGLSKKE